MSTEMIDKLFLELSLVTTASTAKEVELQRQLDHAKRQLKEFDDLTDELTKGIIASSCINPITDMRNAAVKVRGILFKPFDKRDTLGMLYEAWNRLPACELMSVVGAAIQDLQYHQEEIVRVNSLHHLETERLRSQVGSLMKTLAEVHIMNPIRVLKNELKNKRHDIDPELISGQIEKAIAKHEATRIRFKQDAERALASYNAASDIVKAHWSIAPEGSAYVDPMIDEWIEKEFKHYVTVRVIELPVSEKRFILVYGDADDDTVEHGTGGFESFEVAANWFLKGGR